MFFHSVTLVLFLLNGAFADTSNFRFPNALLEEPIIKIVGGQQASPGQFPYQVGMYIQMDLNEVFCGGSLISPNSVLTAAHCILGATSIDVILGAYNITNDSESTRQRQTTTNYTTHPDWSSKTLTNDIALVHLTIPAELNDYVQLINLAFGNDTFENQDGTVCGWGLTGNDETKVTDILKYENNKILTNTECKSFDADYEPVIQTTHLCLSGEGNQGVCNGDSGGALVSEGLQVGITSFNYQSCEAGKPSVFTRISEFTQWIQENSDVVIV